MGADGPGELTDQNPHRHLVQAFALTADFVDPDGDLVAEGDRQGLLAMGAPGHRCVAVIPRQFDAIGFEFIQTVADQCDRVLHLQNKTGIHDVLGGRPPMDVLARLLVALGFALCGHGTDQRHDGMAGAGHFVTDGVEIVQRHVGRLGDLRGRTFGNDAEGRFGAGQGRLHVEKFLQGRGVVEGRAHGGGGKLVAVKDAVDAGNGHGVFLLEAWFLIEKAAMLGGTAGQVNQNRFSAVTIKRSGPPGVQSSKG